ncbi:hypothetical protein [Thiomicrorhabdus sp. Kp2]|uniref:hypothetical protein n=1 Tax=Thiomicrorhabdus sp. Kp2 TaxID=1123518 RepID=UPI00041D3737|nr:hypothetical protein [Thiomicrorhabdus sp. Kp2]
MNLFGKISILIWIIIFIAAAIMFDWFGSREIAVNLLDSSQTAVEKLSETGDHVQDAIEVVSESTEPAREEIREKAAE